MTHHGLVAPGRRWASRFGQSHLKQGGSSTFSSLSQPGEGPASAGHSCPRGTSSPSHQRGLWHCQESSRGSQDAFGRRNASLGFCRAANICQLTRRHHICSSCTVLGASFCTFLTAPILNPLGERESGAFRHRKTNTFSSPPYRGASERDPGMLRQ